MLLTVSAHGYRRCRWGMHVKCSRGCYLSVDPALTLSTGPRASWAGASGRQLRPLTGRPRRRGQLAHEPKVGERRGEAGRDAALEVF
jgi:hypothetical protein